MYTRLATAGGRSILGAVVAGMLLGSGAAGAKDRKVTVSIQVSAKGLDLRKPADAQTFYTRLRNAAWLVCTRGTRADLLPAEDLIGCYEKALGDAVRITGKPLVTQVYLAGHTLQQAVARGIEIPSQIAAK